MPDADRCHPRLRRIRRPGDARPRARAPRSRADRARLRLARRASAASALDPRLNGDLPPFVPNAEALAAGADVVFLCLGHEEAAAPRAAGCRGRRRPLRRAPPARRVAVPGVVRLRASRGPAPGATACPSSSRPSRRSIANPGCYATAALLALAPLAGAIDPASVVVDAKSGVSGAGRGLKASSHAGLRPREPLAVPRRHAPARARDRAGARLPGLLRPASAARAPRSARHVLRAAARPTCARCSRTPTPARPAVRVLDEGVTPELSRVQHTDAAEIALYEDRATGRADRRLRDRQPRQGRGRQRRAERERRARPRRDRGAAARPECSYERDGRAGLHRERRRRAHQQARPRPRARRRATASASAPGCSPPTASRRRRSSSARSISSARSRRRSSSTPGNANAATGAQGLADARATAAETARLLGLEPEQVLVLSTGVIGVPLPMRAACFPASQAPRPRCRPTAAPTPPQAILTTDTRTKEAVVHGARLHRRRHGEGLGDDPPEPRDDARGRHDRLSARAGRGRSISCGRRSTRASTRSRSTASARRTTPSSCSRAAPASAQRRRRVRRRTARGLRRPRAADRRRRRGRDGGRRDQRHAAPRRRPRRRRSRAGSRRRRSSRRRSSARTRTGAACSPPPARRRSTAATRSSTRAS